jgi:8-oxo-dGTP pyrophosphatase MutT (NUDIX family)
MTKQISSATIITDGNKVLIGKITNHRKGRYDFPKGLVEDNEDPKDTAVREVFEETNITIDKNNLIDIGVYPYNKIKDLHVYIYRVDDIDVFVSDKNIYCSSYFETPYGIMLPEISGHKIVYINKLEQYLTYNLYKSFLLFKKYI